MRQIEADGYDPLQLDSFAAIPRALRAVCGAACRRFTADPVADLDAVVRPMVATPLRGKLPSFRGRRIQQTMDRVDVFDLLLAGDFVPPVRASLSAPRATRDPRP
ncbi:MAG: hypothetical protein WKF32_02495 [Thermoleophilaceae bacterium]